MRNLALILEYDGTDYNGFQVQQSLPTVQGEIEQAIAKIVGSPCRINAAGRTDTGVHATGQVVSFTTTSTIRTNQWPNALNAHLPRTIAVRQAFDVPDAFHARFSAKSRSYRYTIVNRPYRLAVGRAYCWRVAPQLDVPAMNNSVAHLMGQHDFSAFAGASHDRDSESSNIRVVLQTACTRIQDQILIDIEANAFLPHMVRNIVGSLVKVGRGEWPSSALVEILASQDRKRAGATAPPQGLCLMRVHYGDQLYEHVRG